ncbi:armadillo repeat-containing protein 5-like [Glandiceps talaboti]
MASTGDSSLTELISKLKYNHSSKLLVDSLTKLRSEFIRRSDGVEKFRKLGGLKPLLDLITKPNERIVDVSMSILANCCLEEETRKKIKHLNGISSIVSILKSLKQSSILNRTSRALANLAVDSDIAEDIHKEEEILPTLVELVKNTEDNECRQSVIRALKNLSKTDKDREAIVDAGGIQPITELLASKHIGVTVSSVRALAEITKLCSLNCAQQVTDADGFQSLVDLMGHAKTVIREHAVLSLFNLMVHGIVRPSVGSAGGVKAFISDIKKSTSTATLSVQLLCLSCREAVNRVKVRELGGLKLMIDMLKQDEYSTHHETIIASFLCFVYDEPSLKIMVANDIVSIFLSHLHKATGQHANSQEMQVSDSSDSEKWCTENEAERIEAKQSACGSEVAESEVKPNIVVDEETNNSSVNAKVVVSAPQNPDPAVQQQFVSPSHSPPMKRHCGPGAWETPTSSTSRGNAYSPYMSPESDTSDKGSSYLSPTYSYSPSYLNNLSPQWSPQDSVYSVYSDTEPDYLVNPQMSPIHISEDMEVNPSEEMSNAQDPWNTSSMAELHVNDGADEDKNADNLTKTQKDEKEDVVDEGSKSSNERQHSGRLVVEGESTELCQGDTPRSKVKTNIEYPEPKGVEHNILTLLSRLSITDDPSSILVTKPCIKSLLKYIICNATVGNRAVRILTRLIRNPYCFEAMISNHVPSLIHLLLERSTKNTNQEEINDEESDKSDSSCYGDQPNALKSKELQEACQMIAQPLLRNLSIQGETPYGQGVVSHALLAGNNLEKTAAAVALPYLYRNTKLRKKMMIEYSGLKILIGAIQRMSQKDEEIVTMAIESLCHLAKNLHISVQATEKMDMVNTESVTTEDAGQLSSLPTKKFKRDHASEDTDIGRVALGKDKCLYIELQEKTDIQFRVENHQMIAANRQLLADKSRVFAAMLSGSYVESTQIDISIDEVSYPALLFLIHYLYSCNTKNCPTMLNLLNSKQRQGQDLELELLACADRFMIPDLVASVRDLIIERHLNFTSVVQLYNYCSLHHCISLQKECLQFILCEDTDLSTRCRCFQEICECKDDVIFNEIFHLVEGRL